MAAAAAGPPFFLYIGCGLMRDARTFRILLAPAVPACILNFFHCYSYLITLTAMSHFTFAKYVSCKDHWSYTDTAYAKFQLSKLSNDSYLWD